MKTLKSILFIVFLPIIILSTELGDKVIIPEMVAVTGGIFKAGTISITISSFKIDKYEVTYELWTEIRIWGLTHGYTDLSIGQNGLNPVGTNNPVTEISWYDMVKWCNARSEKDGYSPVYCTDNTKKAIYKTGQINLSIDAVKWTSNGYRLPTECEWEFAARGGNNTKGYTFSGSNNLSDVAWCSLNAQNSTHSVGTKLANELGIHDMAGNVYEWCWDFYEKGYLYEVTLDPRGPSIKTQGSRSMRGCPFYGNDLGCRLDYHMYDNPSRKNRTYGFRCVKY